MATDKRGVQQIKTMAGLVDSRRSRTSAGALQELSMLEMEKQRLMKELLRAERRGAEIRTRMTEIQTKQFRLQKSVDKPFGEMQTDQTLASAPPFPIFATPPTDRLKRRALAY
jgi:predicted nuclease with TOPRIM domain